MEYVFIDVGPSKTGIKCKQIWQAIVLLFAGMESKIISLSILFLFLLYHIFISFEHPFVSFFKKVIAERGFDPRTSGLWAQHASTAPLCFTCVKLNATVLKYTTLF